ncbi:MULTISPECIES: TauD/TfdA family dioxygenase [Aerosakkonema]|uniref:TauD/TfdA family dioxygenase n=1 Tax=Aerosakkonema TaxID=1246629 RepID=UPI0035B74E97
MSNNYCIVSNTAELPEANRIAFLKEAEAIEIQDGVDPNRVLLSKAPQLAKHLTPIKHSLKLMQQPHGLPYTVLQNMLIDRELPSPPKDGKRPKNKKTWVSETTLLVTASAAGLQPVAYKQEKGELVQQVTPIAGQELSLSNGGRIALGFHTDDAILGRNYRPEYLMLLGLINQCKTPTYIAVLNEALQELSSRHQRILREDRFRIELPESFQLWGGKLIQSEWRSLVNNDSYGEPEIAGNLYSIKTKDKEAQTALNALVDILPYVAKPVVLQPGDLLIFNNHKCLHGRAAVEGGNRWLQRLFARHSLELLRRVTGTSDDTYIFDIQSLVLE